MNQHTMLTAKEASDTVFQCKIGSSKLLKLAKLNEIPCAKLGGRYLFSQEKLYDYLNSKLEQPLH